MMLSLVTMPDSTLSNGDDDLIPSIDYEQTIGQDRQDIGTGPYDIINQVMQIIENTKTKVHAADDIDIDVNTISHLLYELTDRLSNLGHVALVSRIFSLDSAVRVSLESISTVIEFVQHQYNQLPPPGLAVSNEGLLAARWDNSDESVCIMVTFLPDNLISFTAFDDNTQSIVNDVKRISELWPCLRQYISQIIV